MIIQTNLIKEGYLKLNNEVLLKEGFIDENNTWKVLELTSIKETAKAYGIQSLKLEEKIVFWLPKSMIYSEKK